jgi:hypothetical protein
MRLAAPHAVRLAFAVTFVALAACQTDPAGADDAADFEVRRSGGPCAPLADCTDTFGVTVDGVLTWDGGSARLDADERAAAEATFFDPTLAARLAGDQDCEQIFDVSERVTVISGGETFAAEVAGCDDDEIQGVRALLGELLAAHD